MAKLFMLLIGCSPVARNIEQHDVFFGIGNTIKDLVPDIITFWPEAKGKIHVDAWREVNFVNGFSVKVMQHVSPKNSIRLFFINLGGYKRNEFEEFHYKMLVAAQGKADAIKLAKQTAFFRHTGFNGANSHIDDKFGVDVDDIYEIRDILSPSVKRNYTLLLEDALAGTPEDEIHLGYFRLDQIEKWSPDIAKPS